MIQKFSILFSTNGSLVSVTGNDIIVVLLIVAGMLGSYGLSKLTLTASVTGGVIGFLLYRGIGWTGIVMMTLFFLAGTLATSWKRSLKQSIGLVEENKSGRTLLQVLANAGTAAIVSILAIIFPLDKAMWTLLAAAAFSAAAADTLSSELGSVYGKKFYNIITWAKDQRGLDGVVSVEGLGIGLMGSLLIATGHAAFQGWGHSFFIIVFAGTVGNLADSVLGATVERRGLIQNNLVNFANTVVASLVGCALFQAFS